MTERALLTIDLDGVLCRPPFGINPGSGRGKSRTAGGSRNLLWLTERFRYLGRKPMAGAPEGFRALAEQYNCVIVSARGEGTRGQTRRWLERHLGVAPPMYLRPHWRETSAQFKARMLTELKPLGHFEDDPHTAQWAAELVPAVFLVDWPRNRWLQRENIHRIETLAEALPVLDRIAGRES
ncbi:MAG: hypothetical protein WEC33_07850 [Dehalococcoidia bacterium]